MVLMRDFLSMFARGRALGRGLARRRRGAGVPGLQAGRERIRIVAHPAMRRVARSWHKQRKSGSTTERRSIDVPRRGGTVAG